MNSSLQTSNIISICGLKDSGKSTASEMLLYILNAPKGFRTYKWYKLLKKWPFKKKWTLTAFAKPLKKTLSVILNKPLIWFEDRNNKENYYIDLSSLKVYSRKDISSDVILSEGRFQKITKSDEIIPSDYLISIRQLMQYYGTSVIRRYLGDKTWINVTLNKSDSKKIVISDLRFRVEYEEVKKRDGITIYIQRDTAIPGNHSSEREVVELYNENRFDYVINNNGSLENLFNELNKII